MPHKERRNRERQKELGATMVEAAIAMPLFLAILFTSMWLLVLCFKLLRFQYELADITRQTFLLTPLQRSGVAVGGGAGIGWQAFLEDQVTKRLQSIGLSSSLGANNYNVQFSPARAMCEGWGCAGTAQPGDVFSITVTLNEPVFGANLANISLQRLSIDTKAIAFVLQAQNEEV